jgi:hypothetical protein
MNLAKALLSLLAVLPVAGCVLLVAPESYGDSCRFAGKGTPCGTCVAQACQPAVDACCRDDGCATVLELFERCASGDPAGCRSLTLDEQSPQESSRDLATCVASRCRAECALGSTTSKTECNVPLFGNGMSCSCTISDQANDTACSTAAFPDTVCCAPSSWPAPAQRCSCLTLGCSPNASTGECLCGLFDSSSSLHACQAAHCCARRDVCTCQAAPCEPGDTVVPRCELSVIACPVGQVRVDSCSVPVP